MIHHTETTSETNKIKPNYNQIAQQGAITGAIAGGMVSVGNYLESYTGTSPDGVKDPNAYYKPDPEKMINDPEYAAKVYAKFPELKGKYNGFIKPNSLNMGIGNIAPTVQQVGDLVQSPNSWLHEGSSFMSWIESNATGMHNLSLFHDGWGTPNNTLGNVLGLPVINQVTIFVPAIPLSYCTLNPGMCAGIVGDKFNKSK